MAIWVGSPCICDPPSLPAWLQSNVVSLAIKFQVSAVFQVHVALRALMVGLLLDAASATARSVSRVSLV